MRHAFQAGTDPDWLLEEDGYDPMREIDVESRFAVSNGFLGVRGTGEPGRGSMWISWGHTLNWASWPRTYVAGLFETPDICPPVPALVPVADWLRVHIRLDGKPLLLATGHILWHRRLLDMRRGLLITDWRHCDPAGIIVRVRTLRFVSQAERGVGLQLLCLELDQDGVEVNLEAECEEAGIGLEVERLQPAMAVWRTERSGKLLAMAMDAQLRVDENELVPAVLEPLERRWTWVSRAGASVKFCRFVSIVRADALCQDPGESASGALDKVVREGWRDVLATHEAAWAVRWQSSNVVVEGDAAAQRALRFAVYHLNSAANPDDEHVSVGARALTGDGYLGHVFWDTEIYLLPFYTFTWPEAARALLMYRYHTLAGARNKAANMGYRGAMYAWESADTGEETTPRQVLGSDGRPVDVLCGEQEHHITADVAYAVWHYWEATHDCSFLRDAGAEILLETARFWASRAELEPDGLRHIRGVIGPDEYHEHIDDNAFTNHMARWNIRYAVQAARVVRENWPESWANLSSRLRVDEQEFRSWRELADTLASPYDPKTGMLEQFSGFFRLETVALAPYNARTVSIEAVLGRQRIKDSQLIKQADVVALFALLPDEFDYQTQLRNFRYYEPRCTHESSLSRPFHALVAARLGEGQLALEYFRTVAANPVDTARGNPGGIHIAALGGLWQATVFGFAGLRCWNDTLSLDPRLPPGWHRLCFQVQWRGRQIEFAISATQVTTVLKTGDDLTVMIAGRPTRISCGSSVTVGVAANRSEETA